MAMLRCITLPQTEAEAFDGHWGADKLLGAVSDLQDLYSPRCVGFYDGDAIKMDYGRQVIDVTKVVGTST